MNPKIVKLLAIARSVDGIAAARRKATEIREADIRAGSTAGPFPHAGCALMLECLLTAAGIDVGYAHEGAGDLAQTLLARGWERAPRKAPQAGDVAVTQDTNEQPGPDHIFLIVQPMAGGDMCLIADNQVAMPHIRYLSGRGRTPTDYLLRSPG